MTAIVGSQLGPHNDPWEPELNRRHGRHSLTSVEITVTNRCNMRCRHCAVGETLLVADLPRIPLDILLRRLDEVEGLTTLSITGGEPSESLTTLQEYVLPLLRYELIAPYVDVLHISWNYTEVADFHRTWAP